MSPFFSSGLDYVVTKGSEYDFWQEGVYNAHENIYRCFAYKAYSNDFIKMAQGKVYILGHEALSCFTFGKFNSCRNKKN